MHMSIMYNGILNGKGKNKIMSLASSVKDYQDDFNHLQVCVLTIPVKPKMISELGSCGNHAFSRYLDTNIALRHTQLSTFYFPFPYI